MTATVPGFVDLQVNGYRGVDFSSPDLSEKQCVDACRGILDANTAAFLPTLITAPVEVYERNLPLIARVMERTEFQRRLLGLHVEGPFLSGEAGYIGAHPPQHVRAPDVSLLEEMQSWAGGRIRLLTIAAELPGADALARRARELGVAVSIGHSDFTETDLKSVAEAGAESLTHLGNGLPATLPRHPNPIWAGLAEDRLTAMVIADGHHIPDSLLRTVLRTKGVNRTVVVSDLSPVAGLEPGEHICFGQRVTLEPSGRVSLPGTGLLAASALPMFDAMNRLASLDWLSETDLLAIGFHNPLRLIGVSPSEVRAPTRLRFGAAALQFSLETTE